MVKDILIIKPVVGLGNLNFGSTVEQAIALFGNPEETEEMDSAGEYPSMVLHFWSKGFSLFFDHSHGKKFSCAEVDNRSTLLWEMPVFSLSETQLKDLFSSKGYNQSETEKHEWGENRISFDEALIDFYFEKGKMSSINFSIPPDGKPQQVLILPN
ncbi:MAG: hypothetical protein IT233_07195 [Bacteroidia bacterium]|nr:hypothetical protein [Bacteroidia bacterium]